MANSNDVADAIFGDRRIDLGFECEGDPTAWEVADLVLVESLSDTYTAHAELRTSDGAADPGALLGKDVLLTIGRGGHERRLCGKVTHVEHGSVVSTATIAKMVTHVVVEPALCALKQIRDSRIFQNQSAVEIVEKVLAETLPTYNRSHDARALKRTYPQREYTVQYRESSFDFIQRLLAEEGIGYCFDHSGAVEKLVLVDTNSDYPELLTHDAQPVPLVQTRSDIHGGEPVFAFNRQDQTTTTHVVVKDFDWTKPTLDVSKAEGPEDAQGAKRERYEPAHVTLGKYQKEGYTENDVDARALLLHESIAMQQRVFVGEGLVTGLVAGSRFELVDHPLPGFDGKYLVTSVTHQAGLSGAGEEDSTDRYINRFTAIPVEVPFRPEQLTPKPRMQGLQTAFVVGPEGNEIYTDEHGRIKVQFHWDREGKRDGDSSCYLRVAQQWAGSGYGFVFVPRIGMEVLVSFLEGDPDRPLVTGCVYDGDNRLRYPLPANETRTLIRTKSFKGEGFNEIRFDDAQDGEEIFVHASRDYNEVVENDHSTDVKGKQSNTVAKSHSESVGGSQSLSVGGNRTVSVTGSQSVTISGSSEAGGVTGGKVDITGDYKLDTSQTIAVQAPNSIKLECGGSTILMEPGKISIKAGGGAEIVLDANALTKSSQGTQVLLDANALTQSSGGSKSVLDANVLNEASGGAKVLLDGNVLSESSGGAKVVLDANVLNESSGGAQVVLDRNALLKGLQATVKGDTAAQLDATGNVKADPSGVTIMGTMVKIN